MDEPQRPSTPMEDLLAEALACIEERGPQALDELCAQHPELAAGLRQRVAWLLGSGLARPEPRDGFRHPDQLGDFKLLEPLGHGGMGVVYRATQLTLDREVALKLVRPEQLYFPEARRRFQREVTTVAALAHPGIVPVYAVGEEQGVPYCAMELVRGAALSAILGCLQGRDPGTLQGADLVAALDACAGDPSEPASQLFEGPWPTVCTRIAREVAEALEHAHRRGVVHRDIKPSNVMITRGGRVLLVDFGLSSHAATDERQTRTGAQVGTLAYMPPEQLRGERDVDARADVYALGVTLYELLALRLPFDPDPRVRATQGADAAPVSLRRRDPRVNWELETVVQTASEADPRRRYGSAEDLAADLTRVLEGRPIEARRSSAWLRARRWMRRHPALTALTAAVLLGPSLLFWQQVRSNRVISSKTREVQQANARLGDANEQLAASNGALAAALDETALQRDAAQAARARAERAFDRAFDSIELMLGRVGGEVLEDVPGVEPIRRELLNDALRMHAELLAEPVVDARQRALHATTLRRSAMIHTELGDYRAALEALDREAELLDELLLESLDEELRLTRGLLDFRRGEVLKLLGELDVAEDFARLAVERLEELEAESEPSAKLVWPLARARMELADVVTRAGRPAEREEPLHLAFEGLRSVGASEAGTARERRELARALHLWGSPPSLVASLDGAPLELSEGAQYLELAAELRHGLVLEDPTPAARRELAETLLAQSVYAAGELDYQGAYALLEEAWELYARLHEEFPARPVYLDGAAAASLNLSQLSLVLQLRAERAQWLDRAVAGFAQLVESVPEGVQYRRNLGLCLGQLGSTYLEPGPDLDPERAAELLQRSIDLCRPLLAGPRSDPNLRLATGWAHSQLVLAHAARRDARAVRQVAHSLLALDVTPVETIYVVQFLSTAIAVAREPGGDVPAEDVGAWEEEALGLVERTLETAPGDRAVQAALTGPDIGVIAEDPRFVALLNWYGLGE